MKFFSGYQGPPLPPPEYLGLGMIIVLVAGVVAWRRDRRLWFFGALGLITLLASLGVKSYWTPWRLLTHVPLVQNVIPSRLVAIISLCVAIMMAIVIDRAHRSVRSWAKGLGSTAIQHRQVLTGRLAGAVAGFTALALVAVALVPIGSALASNTPLTTRAVTLPGWFSDIAPHLPPGEVLLTYPPPGIGSSTLAWQAVDSLHFAIAMGVGPESILQRAGKERAGQSVINAAAFSFDGPPKATAANIDAVRQALTGWGVTMVAVADPKTLVPPFGQFDNTAWTIALFTIVLHRLPQFRGDTWVWRDVATSVLGRHYAISASAFAGCTGPQIYQSPSRLAVPSCVLSAAQLSS
jgi:hypothetical protein